MKYIKGVYRHGSENFLMLLKDDKTLETKSIIKASTSEKGVKSIMSECEGIEWYNSFSKNKIEYTLEKKIKTYHRIKIEINSSFFNVNPSLNYLMIEKYLDLTINHYIQIWDKYKGYEFAPFHGDLSLVGNVMFNDKNEVLFVDWEQFSDNMNIPTGLDVTMTLMENIYYEIIRYKKIKKNVMKHFVNSIQYLNKSKLLSRYLLDSPAINTLNFINSHTDIWNGQHLKLPVLKLSKNVVQELDNAISKII